MRDKFFMLLLAALATFQCMDSKLALGQTAPTVSKSYAEPTYPDGSPVYLSPMILKAVQNTTPQPVVLPADLAQIMEAVKAVGGASGMARLAAIITLLISALKVSALNPLWDKLGPLKPWAAPMLGMVAGIATTAASGVVLTPALVVTYACVGGGSLYLHEFLDLLKKVPGVGPVYLRLIEAAQKSLGGPKTPPPA